MIYPDGVTEQQFLDTTNQVLNVLASKFKFGYLSIEDIRQEGFVFAIEGLHKYDGSHPLENFLYIHIRNQFINYKRKLFTRKDLPCLMCPFYDPQMKQSTNQCSEFSNKWDCDKYNSWMKRNRTKQNLVQCPTLDTNKLKVLDTNYTYDAAQNNELVTIIDEKLPIKLRADYNRMRDGESLPKARREKVREAITTILKEKGYLD